MRGVPSGAAIDGARAFQDDDGAIARRRARAPRARRSAWTSRRACCRAGAPLRADAASGWSRSRAPRAPRAAPAATASAAIALSASASRTRRARDRQQPRQRRAHRVAAAAAADDRRCGERRRRRSPHQPRRNISSGRSGSISSPVAHVAVAEQVDEDAARAGGVRGARREPRGAGHAGRAADDGDVAEAALVRGMAPRRGRAAGSPLPTSQASASVAASPSTPRRAQPDRPAWSRPAAGEEARLGRDQRQRVVGDDAGGAERLAAIGVEPGRHVDGEHAGAARGELGDARDRGGDRRRPAGAMRRCRGGRRSRGRASRRPLRRCASKARSSTPAALRARQRLRRVGGQRGGVADSATTDAALPRSRSRVAASMPSPPLLPGPAKTTMRRACGARASASRATASPARAIERERRQRARAPSLSIRRVAATPSSGDAADGAVDALDAALIACSRSMPSPSISIGVLRPAIASATSARRAAGERPAAAAVADVEPDAVGAARRRAPAGRRAASAARLSSAAPALRRVTPGNQSSSTLSSVACARSFWRSATPPISALPATRTRWPRRLIATL